MMDLFLVSGMISPLEIAISVFSGLFFLIAFGLSSAKGGYQDLIKTTLANDEIKRKNKN